MNIYIIDEMKNLIWSLGSSQKVIKIKISESPAL